MKLSTISSRLSKQLAGLSFSEPVTHVYDPTDYARGIHRSYLDRFGEGPKEAMLLGMNPGPWGMAQTGVPFGEIAAVRDWMKLDGSKIGKPKVEHPKRPITGFECARSEVSGARMWGFFKERFPSPDAFFERFFVANYCPLVFMEESGRNFVPEKLPVAEREPLLAACDEALLQTVKSLKPKLIIGVGVWAKKRAQKALAELDLPIEHILHPSPASPAANRGWAPQAEAQLKAMGITV